MMRLVMQYVYILCQNYLDEGLKDYSIGGIETYIHNLIKIICEMNMTPIIIQYANVDAIREMEGIKVIGVNIVEFKHLRHMNRQLYNCFMMENQKKPGLLIYATEGLIAKKTSQNIPTIAIQHGISWDKPDYARRGRMQYEAYYWMQALIHRIVLRKIEYADQLICVDYNYVNWYRALVAYSKIQLSVIPNFTFVPSEISVKKNNEVKIIFARRFYEYRGTRIFAKAIKRLLQEYSKIDITFAGEGPDEVWLKTNLPECENIHYIKYQSKDTFRIHKDKDIAVVPTIGSEGTSLSLLEAMASGCAVVCSNVGGMTNIIIDQYNGIMIDPNENALYNALKQLIDNRMKREVLALRAYETVKNGFSFELWKEKWTNVICDMLSRNNEMTTYKR